MKAILSRNVFLGFSLVLVSAGIGCGVTDRAELAKVKAELAEAQTELRALKVEKKQGYLDELERLDSLRAKGVLTQAEFDAKKKSALSAPPLPEPPRSAPERARASMDELAKQLRTVHGLYNNNVINNLDRDQKKKQLIEGHLVLLDLKKDLETVQALYNESVITNLERDALKKRLLEAPPNKE